MVFRLTKQENYVETLTKHVQIRVVTVRLTLVLQGFTDMLQLPNTILRGSVYNSTSSQENNSCKPFPLLSNNKSWRLDLVHHIHQNEQLNAIILLYEWSLRCNGYLGRRKLVNRSPLMTTSMENLPSMPLSSNLGYFLRKRSGATFV